MIRIGQNGMTISNIYRFPRFTHWFWIQRLSCTEVPWLLCCQKNWSPPHYQIRQDPKDIQNLQITQCTYFKWLTHLDFFIPTLRKDVTKSLAIFVGRYPRDLQISVALRNAQTWLFMTLPLKAKSSCTIQIEYLKKEKLSVEIFDQNIKYENFFLSKFLNLFFLYPRLL